MQFVRTNARTGRYLPRIIDGRCSILKIRLIFLLASGDPVVCSGLRVGAIATTKAQRVIENTTTALHVRVAQYSMQADREKRQYMSAQHSRKYGCRARCRNMSKNPQFQRKMRRRHENFGGMSRC